MFRHFHSYNYNPEIDKELNRTKYLAQLVIDEYDLFLLSKSLLSLTKRDVNLEIVIISTTEKKSLKLVNLCKRLIDSGAQIFWKIDKDLFSKADFHALFDMQYLISSLKQLEYETPEALVRFKTDAFNALCSTSTPLRLKSGEIEIRFGAESVIVHASEKVVLHWDTKNAHQVEIMPSLGLVQNSGSQEVKLHEDTHFKLLAKNKDHSAKKALFIKVIQHVDLEFSISVFDTIINEYIPLSPSTYNSSHYAVYKGQKVNINWDIGMVGRLTEANLGNLLLKDDYEFNIEQNVDFVFVFRSLNHTTTKTLNFYCFDDDRKAKPANAPKKSFSRKRLDFSLKKFIAFFKKKQ